MFKFTKNSVVDVEKYTERIQKNGIIYLDKDRMKMNYEYEKVMRDSLYSRVLSHMRYTSNGIYNNCSRDALVGYLTRFEHCPEHYFSKRGVQGYSVDMGKVLTPLYENGYAKDFLALYMDHSSLKSRCSNILKMIEVLREPAGVNEEEKEIYPIFYSVNEQINRRFNYKNFDIISQIPKALDGYVVKESGYVDAITCPKGYCLAWGDFAQSDLRIALSLLIRDKDNAEVFSQCEDMYEAVARLVSKFTNTEFDLEKFKEERKKYKVHTLATIYGTRNTVVNSAKSFITTLSNYIQSCPKYAEYVSRIQTLNSMGVGIPIKSYFGHEQYLSPATGAGREAMYFSLNSPCQTGSSEAVILTVNKILDLFYENGYTDEDISIYMIRHDEPVFILKEEVLKDAWIFEQARKVIVDDWIPLQLDFSFGYYYKKEDEHLGAMARKSIELNKEKIEIFEPSGDSTTYYPVQGAAELFVHYEKFQNKTIAAVISKKLKASNFHLIDSINEEDIKNTLIQKIEQEAIKFRELGYNGLLIRSNFLKGEVYSRGILLKFIKEEGSSLFEADSLAKHMTNRYAMKQKELPPFAQQNLDNFKDWGNLAESLDKMLAEKS